MILIRTQIVQNHMPRFAIESWDDLCHDGNGTEPGKSEGDRMKRLSQITILVALAAAIVWAVMNNAKPKEKADVGYTAPNFTLMTMERKNLNLSQLRGKPVFLNFWASWCEYCKEETPDLVNAYRQYKDQVQFIGVDVAASDPEANAKQFIQDFHIPYPVVTDRDGSVTDTYKVSSLPTSFFLDKDGRIVDKVIGALTPEQIRQELNKLTSK
jgi:cytochrome c biogenesis protein CcmG, thiol:disulfide interchange protein DsbE